MNTGLLSQFLAVKYTFRVSQVWVSFGITETESDRAGNIRAPIIDFHPRTQKFGQIIKHFGDKTESDVRGSVPCQVGQQLNLSLLFFTFVEENKYIILK